MQAALWVGSLMVFAKAGGAHPLCVAAEFAYLGRCCLHRLGHSRTSLSPRPCHSHDHWVEKLPHPTGKYVVVAVAMEATERTVKICVPFFCKGVWEKLLHLLGRTQGGRASNLPSVNMARSCLSLPEFLKQSGSKHRWERPLTRSLSLSLSLSLLLLPGIRGELGPPGSRARPLCTLSLSLFLPSFLWG